MTTQKLLGWCVELFGIVSGYLAGTATRQQTINRLHQFIVKVSTVITDEY